jgi:hypothetical protein
MRIGQQERSPMTTPQTPIAPTDDLSADRSAKRARDYPVEVAVEFAAADGILTTREGPMQYRRGDALLTGIEGERWPVTRKTFDDSYQAVPPLRPGKAGRYCKRPRVVWAKSMRQPFTVTLDQGRGELRGEAGDWLVQYAPGRQSVVDAAVFARTYELLD